MKVEENDLEIALRLAADDPAQRPEFMRLLLETKVLVLGQTDTEIGKDGILRKGSNLLLVHWEEDGKPILPFFTSVTALQRAITKEAEYVQLDARALFESTRGATLRLNGGSPYGKYFLPQEIESLLAIGSSHIPETRIIERETPVQIANLLDPPEKLLSALTRLFEKTAQVNSAYLALMRSELVSKPGLLLGIDADGEFDPIARDAGVVASGCLSEGELIDIIRIDRGEQGLSSYFNERVQPFYKKSLWRSLFGKPGRA